ncbi:MAG: BtpA/SgcQ family protein [Bryobacteraceae bacterium]
MENHRNAWLNEKPVIGVLHVPALPGSPRSVLSFSDIRDWVMRDAEAYWANGVRALGVDALLLENFGDAPYYPERVPAETVAFMTSLACHVRSRFDLPLGINILRCDGESALAIAEASGAEFIRVATYSGARVADQAVLQGKAHQIQRLKRELGSQIAVFADVMVRHSATTLGGRTLEDVVEDTVERALADAVIVSGPATATAPGLLPLQAARVAAKNTRVFDGSGVREETIQAVLEVADGAIVGTAFKVDGVVTNPVDPERVRRFMDAARASHSAGPGFASPHNHGEGGQPLVRTATNAN